MIAPATSCRNCTKEFVPINNRELYSVACSRCLKRVDRAIRELGWKSNHKKTVEDKKIPGLFWVPGKKKKKKGFENLYRMREN